MGRTFCSAIAAALLTLGAAATVGAHPMPDTQIVVDRSANQIALTIRLPVAELLIAQPLAGLGNDDPTPESIAKLRAYFAGHTAIVDASGKRYPLTLKSIEIEKSSDAEVGTYSELVVRAIAPVTASEAVFLDYDGIMHRVANHRAFIQNAAGAEIGVVGYNLARKDTNLVALAPSPRSAAADAGSPSRTAKAHASGLSIALGSASIITALIMTLGIGLWRKRRRKLLASEPDEVTKV